MWQNASEGSHLPVSSLTATRANYQIRDLLMPVYGWFSEGFRTREPEDANMSAVANRSGNPVRRDGRGSLRPATG